MNKDSVINDKTIVLVNGTNSLKTNSLLVNEDELCLKEDSTIRLVHIINTDCVINIKINNDVVANIEEVYLEFANDCKVDVNIECGERARLQLTSFFQNTGKRICANVKTKLNESSYINNKSITLISNDSEGHEEIYLEKDSKIDRLSVVINTNNAVFDSFCDVSHLEEDTTSNFITYGICKEKAILNINTNGKIKKDAKRSNLYQKSKGLLLNLESSISANPVLEIDEFDCLASHGASIGAIDQEELYYLMSRGLSKEASEQLIVKGFINPFISSIEDIKLKEYIENAINKAL